MCQIHISRFKLFLVLMDLVEHGDAICMIIRKIYGRGHIREKQQFENYHFLAFFTLFYLKQPILLNMYKFGKNTPTEETLI